MKFLKLIILGFVVCIAQVACSDVVVSYSETTPISYNVQIPALVSHGDKYEFIVETESNAICHAGIAYYDKKNRWAIDEFQNKIADETGVCKWNWEVPSNAKDGVGEFRGYVENDKRKTNLFPENFCIEICP